MTAGNAKGVKSKLGSMKKKLKSRESSKVEDRKDEAVHLECERWWIAAQVKAMRKRDAQNVSDSKLSREEYEVFYKRLMYAFNIEEEAMEVDADDMRQALEVDWKNDRYRLTYLYVYVYHIYICTTLVAAPAV
jgi:hypothetical protein